MKFLPYKKSAKVSPKNFSCQIQSPRKPPTVQYKPPTVHTRSGLEPICVSHELADTSETPKSAGHQRTSKPPTVQSLDTPKSANHQLACARPRNGPASRKRPSPQATNWPRPRSTTTLLKYIAQSILVCVLRPDDGMIYIRHPHNNLISPPNPVYVIYNQAIYRVYYLIYNSSYT